MATSSDIRGVETIRRNAGWYIALGILMVMLGLFAISYAFLTTIVSIVVFGWLLIGSGILYAIQAFHDRKWSGVVLDLFLAVLVIGVGALVIAAPMRGALTVTVLLASYLIVGGLVRVFGSVAFDVPGRGWMAVSGIISMLLGLLLWIQWPLSAIWAIGTFVGLDLVLQGVTWISMAMAVRRISRTLEEPRTAH